MWGGVVGRVAEMEGTCLGAEVEVTTVHGNLLDAGTSWSSRIGHMVLFRLLAFGLWLLGFGFWALRPWALARMKETWACDAGKKYNPHTPQVRRM